MQRVAYVIDDDQGVRVATTFLLRSAGAESRPYASADDFLADLHFLQPGCLVVDIRMPGKDGVALISELREAGYAWPAIVMTGHAVVSTAVKVMKLGAIEFLEKPFRDRDLIEALERGWAMLAASSQGDGREREAQRVLAKLTERESDVLDGIVAGLSNKEIAARLGLSHRTVEMHRANLMRRTGARRVADLLLLAAAGGRKPDDGLSSLLPAA